MYSLKGKLEVFRFSTRKRTVYVPCMARAYEERVLHAALLNIRSETNQTVKRTAYFIGVIVVSRVSYKSCPTLSWSRAFRPDKARVGRIQIDCAVDGILFYRKRVRSNSTRWL